MSLAEDLLADGEPEKEHHAGIATRQPRKRVAGGALIHDGSGRLLFVIPNYKPGLEIPGGMAEENESPAAACRREIREELGLELDIGELLVVDWLPAHGVWPDGLMFLFNGGVIDSVAAPGIAARDPELDGTVFMHLADAAPRLRPSMMRRLTTALDALRDGRPRYAEFGRSGLTQPTE
ncbi:MAG: NUDIX hydrolase [Actinobacteria bacterium]|nr:NUDIX hydrolase [Actinomycetota bacterium]MBI3686225.1 NUDIX hydrolase [Actinomycetota bacterium]